MVAHPFLVDIEHLSNKGVIIGPYNHEVSNKEAKYTIDIARTHVRQHLKQSIRSRNKIIIRLSMTTPLGVSKAFSMALVISLKEITKAIEKTLQHDLQNMYCSVDMTLN